MRNMVLKGLALAVAGALLAAGAVQAAPASSAVARARAAIAESRRASPTPALSVAVVRGGEVVWAEAQGLADLEQDVRATPATRFRLGSVSKVVTATLAARLAQQGVLDLDAPISRYLPDLPAHHRATTLRQLLGHQGGVRHYADKDFAPTQPGGTIDQRAYASTADALAIFIDDPLIAPPGTRYAYSTFSYTLASAVMEAAAKRPFLDLVEDELARPLKLSSLKGDQSIPLMPSRTRFYDPAPQGAPAGGFVNAPAVNVAYKWAGGGFIATPSDIARLGYALIRPGYLDAATHRMVFTNLATADGKPTLVGLGWRVDKDRQGRTRWHHAGAIDGGRAVVVIYPDLDLSVAFMTNLSQTPGEVLIPAEAIADAFAGKP